MRTIASFVLGAGLTLSSLLAANWPEWRGPERNGITSESGLPLKWSATENIKWKVPLPGPGNSTPIVWENKVLITQALEGGDRVLLCLDRKNGKELWRAGTTFKEQEESHDTNPQCSASPATDGKRVVAWFGSAGLFCYDMDGKELWKRDLGQQTHSWGWASSPIIHDDLVILNFGPGKRSFVAAFEKETGKPVWQMDVPEVQPETREDNFAGSRDGVIGSWSTPIVVKANGREELIVSLPDKVQALDPKTGSKLWHCDGPNPLLYTSPVFADGLIVVMGGFHGPTIAIKPGGTGDVTSTHRVWKVNRPPNRIGSGVAKNGFLYSMEMPGLAACIDLKSGNVVWKERVGTGPKKESWSNVILSGDRVYAVNQSGDTIVFKASPAFELLAVNSIGNEMTNSSLAASNGEIFLRTHENLWCIAAQTKTASR